MSSSSSASISPPTITASYSSSASSSSSSSSSSLTSFSSTYSPSNPLSWIAASKKQPTGDRAVILDADFNKFGLLKFGDDAVDVIYEHLGPHDLAMCGRVCREMRPHMYRLSERCVRRLRKLHMDNPHVRVPTPGEILYQEQQEPAKKKNKKAGGGGGKEKEETVTIVAGNYLRQFRDMLKQRVMVMGGKANRVDMLDVVVVSSESKT